MAQEPPKPLINDSCSGCTFKPLDKCDACGLFGCSKELEHFPSYAGIFCYECLRIMRLKKLLRDEKKISKKDPDYPLDYIKMDTARLKNLLIVYNKRRQKARFPREIQGNPGSKKKQKVFR
jgi:hypothetical protein